MARSYPVRRRATAQAGHVPFPVSGANWRGTREAIGERDVVIAGDGTEGPRGPAPSRRRAALDVGVRFLVLAGALYVVGVVVARLWLVVLPFLLALLLASVLQPPAAWLAKRGLPPLAATWVVVLGGLLAVGGCLVFAGRALYQDLPELGDAVGAGWDRATAALEDSPLGVSADEVRDALSEAGGADPGRLLAGAFSGALAAVHVVTVALLTLFFTFFFVKDGRRLFEGATGWLDDGRRRLVREAGERVWDNLSTYVRNMAIIALVNAVQTALVLVLLGVPLALPVAVLTFLGSFVPFVGPVVAGVAGGLVALAHADATVALLFLAIELAYQQVEGNVLEPMLLGKGMRLHPVVIAASVTGGAVVAGIAGAVLAVPLVSAAFTLALYARELDAARHALAGAGDAPRPTAGVPRPPTVTEP